MHTLNKLCSKNSQLFSWVRQSIKCEKEAASAAAGGNYHEGDCVAAATFNFIEIYRT